MKTMKNYITICMLLLVAGVIGCGAPAGDTSGSADTTVKDTTQKDTVKDTYNPAAAPATNGQF